MPGFLPSHWHTQFEESQKAIDKLNKGALGYTGWSTNPDDGKKEEKPKKKKNWFQRLFS